MLVLNDELTHGILLTKLHGPLFLRNKDNFPGGHIEPKESPELAAIREVKEETGVEVKDVPIVLLQHKIMDTSELYTYAACVPNEMLRQAQSRTDEPVRIEELKTYLATLAIEPARAAVDVKDIIESALHHFNTTHNLSDGAQNLSVK